MNHPKYRKMFPMHYAIVNHPEIVNSYIGEEETQV